MSQTTTDYSTLRPAVSIAEYRELLNDDKSSDEQIEQRLQYIENLCRNLIRQELAHHVD